MKLIIASDIHGSATATKQLARRIEAEAPDRIVLLGDLLYHGPRNPLPEGYDPQAVAKALNALSERIVAVRGNCDAEVDQMMLDFPCMADSAQIIDGDYTLFCTHGHVFEPAQPPTLPVRSAFLSGHTHVKMLELRGGLVFVNPGSISLPKDGSASYAVYENGRFALKLMDGQVISQLALR